MDSTKTERVTCKGFRSIAHDLDHGLRIKYSRPKAPKGIEITDAMMDAAAAKVQKQPDVRRARHTKAGEIVVTPRHYRSACKAIELFKQLKQMVFRWIVEAMISEIRKAKRKLRQATAIQKQEKAEDFVNDKTKTMPVPAPAT